MPDNGPTADPYDVDLNLWAHRQAEALRAVGDALHDGNDYSRHVRTIDWNNLAEEIEGLARKDRRELASRIAAIVEHPTNWSSAATFRHAPDGWTQ